jgi:hypothetical protein
VSFLNAANELIFPEYAITVFEMVPSCSGYVVESDVVIVKPAVTNARCGQLIKNGGFDSGLEFWQNGAGPFVTSGVLTTTTRTNAVQNSIMQWVDATCIQAGNCYNFTLDYRLVNASGMNVVVACDIGGSCPSASVLAGDFDPTTGIVTESWMNLGKTDLPYKTGTSFNTMSGSWTVTSAQAAAEKIRIVILNGNGEFIIDNVKLTQVNLAPTNAPANIVSTIAPVTQSLTMAPTKAPTNRPTTNAPTNRPTTKAPTNRPTTKAPTNRPTTKSPTKTPTTKAPTKNPTTKAPTKTPTTKAPTKTPTTHAPVTAAPA